MVHVVLRSEDWETHRYQLILIRNIISNLRIEQGHF